MAAMHLNRPGRAVKSQGDSEVRAVLDNKVEHLLFTWRQRTLRE